MLLGERMHLTRLHKVVHNGIFKVLAELLQHNTDVILMKASWLYVLIMLGRFYLTVPKVLSLVALLFALMAQGVGLTLLNEDQECFLKFCFFFTTLAHILYLRTNKSRG